MLIFQFLPKILEKCDFDGFLLIMKGNGYHTIHREFQVHSTSIFELGGKKQKSESGNHPLYP